MAQQRQAVIELPKIAVEQFQLTLIGDSPLICHKWSEKAKKQMLDKHMGVPKTGKKENKDPQRDYKESLYEYPGGGYGFPTVAFKSAAVDACSTIEGVTKVQARGAFHINGDLLKIEGKPSIREDMDRVFQGKPDIRYRGEFKEWRTSFVVRYRTDVLNKEQIINLFNIGGFAVGVGEWRPQKDGSFGMFHVGNKGDK